MMGFILSVLAQSALTSGIVPFDPSDDKYKYTSKVKAHYQICLMAEAMRYAKESDESIETVVTAAFGSCILWRSTLRSAAVMLEPSFSPQELDDILAEWQARIRPEIFSFAMNERLKRSQRARRK